MIDSLLEWLDQFPTGAEDLQLVVLGRTDHDPWIILIEIEVADAVGEATVHEQSAYVSKCSQGGYFRLTVRVARHLPPPPSARHQSC